MHAGIKEMLCQYLAANFVPVQFSFVFVSSFHRFLLFFFLLF